MSAVVHSVDLPPGEASALTRRLPLVRVYPNSNNRHLFQIYAGLYELRAAGRIALELTSCLSSAPPPYAPSTLWAEVEDPNDGRIVKLCFDMLDGDNIASMEALEQCDRYFKRSYTSRVFHELPLRLARRVAPYGLNYACVSKTEPFISSRLFAEWRLKRRGLVTSLCRDNGAYSRAFQLMFVRTRFAGSKLCPYLPAEYFEIPPDRPAQRKILFQTRLWKIGPGTERWREMNEQRVAIIRALAHTFGDRFVGGLEDTPLARELHPDLILNSKSSRKKDYIDKVSQCLVTITTTGLFDSIGWKLPEYLAASRCIVCEPHRYELPVPLEAGLHFLPANSPAATVAACDRLLGDPDLARRMRVANFRYYLENVQPAALLRRCLNTALSMGSSSRATEPINGSGAL